MACDLHLEIRAKYLKAPTFEEISEFMKELGVCGSQFERYFSIPPSVIRSVKLGKRNLPVKFWPIIYEKRVPKYELAYLKKAAISSPKPLATKNATPPQTENVGHGRLNRLK